MIDFYNILNDMTIWEARLYYIQGMAIDCADGEVVGMHKREDADDAK